VKLRVKKTTIMHKLFILFYLLCLTCSSTPSPQSNSTTFETFHTEYRSHKFDVIRLDPSQTNLQFCLTNDQGKKYRSFKNLKTTVEAKGQKLNFAMNGGMYLKDGTPQGLYIENGKTIQQIDTTQEAYGNFYLQPNGIFYIENKKGFVNTTSHYLKGNFNPDFATQSGPMLVIENKIHPAFVEGSKNIHIRNGVGIDAAGKIVLAISNNKLNLFDFAMFFKEKMNCKNALYLDGFVSKAYIPDLNRMEIGGNFGVIISGIKREQ